MSHFNLLVSKASVQSKNAVCLGDQLDALENVYHATQNFLKHTC